MSTTYAHGFILLWFCFSYVKSSLRNFCDFFSVFLWLLRLYYLTKTKHKKVWTCESFLTHETSWHKDAFNITDPLWWQSFGHRWGPIIKWLVRWNFDISLMLVWTSCWAVKMPVICDAMTLILRHCNRCTLYNTHQNYDENYHKATKHNHSRIGFPKAGYL